MARVNILYIIIAVVFIFCGQACRKETISLRTFQEISCPVAEDLSGIWMTDSLHGFIVGGKPWESGFILSTADGGMSWKVDTLLNRKLECVMFDRNGQGYACGQDYALFRPPGSTLWYNFRVNYYWNNSCYFPDNQYGIMVSGEGYEYGQASTFGSEDFWRLDTLQQFPNALADVWFSDSVTAHAVGIGWVMRSDDAGQSWRRLDLTGDFFRSVHFPSPSTGYICGYNGTILKSADSGQSWQTIREGGSTGKRNKPFRALWFVSPETGYVAGDNGLLWRSENGGAEWAQVEEAPADADFTCVFASGHRGWTVAREGRIFYFEQ